MDDELVASGRYAPDRDARPASGLERFVTIGFVEDQVGPTVATCASGASGAILVAAGAADAFWARNLLGRPGLPRVGGGAVVRGDRGATRCRRSCRVVRESILRYGTPAEGLGHGPSFRLRPVGGSETAADGGGGVDGSVTER